MLRLSYNRYSLERAFISSRDAWDFSLYPAHNSQSSMDLLDFTSILFPRGRPLANVDSRHSIVRCCVVIRVPEAMLDSISSSPSSSGSRSAPWLHGRRPRHAASKLACRAFFSQIVSLQYFSRSSLHHLAGLQTCHLVRIVRIQYGFWPFLR